MSRDDPRRLSDEDLRLECARLAAVFTTGDDLADNATRLYRFIRKQPEPDPVKMLRLRADGSQKRLAREAGLSEPYVSQVLNGHRVPCEKLLRLVGLKRVVRYEPMDFA